ncbi:MAG: hypothetical protein ACLPZY_17580 [Terracidiphilus sp.]
MRSGGKRRYASMVLVFIAIAAAETAPAQTAKENRDCAGANDAAAIVVLPARSASAALGEIDDPATGDRWLMERNEMHPEGPGRLVRLAGVGGAAGGFASAVKVRRQDAAGSDVSRQIVIHDGDVLVLEEHTALVDARLEAVALGSAMRGEELRVRLKIGGKVVRAVATIIGRAELLPAAETRP